MVYKIWNGKFVQYIELTKFVQYIELTKSKSEEFENILLNYKDEVICINDCYYFKLCDLVTEKLNNDKSEAY